MVVCHENLIKLGKPNTLFLYFANQSFVFGSEGYPLPISSSTSKYIFIFTYSFNKFPWFYYWVSGHFSADTWCTNYFMISVCFRLNDNALHNIIIIANPGKNILPILLGVSHSIHIHICDFESLAQCIS